PLPPPGGATVPAQDPRPPAVLQLAGQFPPTLTGDARGPGHERVDDERHWKQTERVCHRSRVGLAQHPTLHHRIELDPSRVDLGTPAQPYPAVENDEGDQGKEQRTLCDGDDDEEMTARHLPTQRLIFSRATRRLIGFTM